MALMITMTEKKLRGQRDIDKMQMIKLLFKTLSLYIKRAPFDCSDQFFE